MARRRRQAHGYLAASAAPQSLHAPRKALRDVEAPEEQDADDDLHKVA
jgi:hypothetical protein